MLRLGKAMELEEGRAVRRIEGPGEKDSQSWCKWSDKQAGKNRDRDQSM